MSLLASTLQCETQEKGKLHDNAFAKALLPLMGRFSLRLTDVADWENEDRIAREVRTVVMGIVNNTFKNLPEVEYSFNQKDCRIRKIHVKGVRTFPAEENRYYTLSMSRPQGECCSCVFLGNNGIGKTSFYCGLEWATLGYSDSANHRGYTKGKQIEFLRNLRTNPEDVSILLETMSGNRACDVTMPVPPIAYPAFFCMERDVELLSKEVSESYIAYQLGVLDFKVFLQTLQKIIKEYEEGMATLLELRNKLKLQETTLWLMDRVNGLDTDLRKKITLYLQEGHEILNRSHLDNNEKVKFAGICGINIRQIVEAMLPSVDDVNAPDVATVYEILPKYTESLVNNITEDAGSLGGIERDQYMHKLSGVYKELYEMFADWAAGKNAKLTKLRVLENAENKQKRAIKATQNAIAKVENQYPASRLKLDEINQLKEIHTVIRQEYDLLLSELKAKADEVFRHLFKDFFKPDLKKVELVVGPELKVVVTTCNPLEDADEDIGLPTGPRHFLNNLRFQLFCVALKVALAFTCSSITGLNFPIVMDDVFDSSDFSNRLNIRSFIKNLYSAYDRIFYSPESLQIIFFTQDDVIGDAVVRAIRECDPESGVKYSRLFSYAELEDKEWKSMNVNGKFNLPGSPEKIVYGYVEDLIS